MSNLYVMYGIMGAGKTTAADILGEIYGARVHSYDRFPNARGNPDIDGKIKEEYTKAIIRDLKQGYDVICDDANILLNDRMYLLNKLKDINCVKTIYILDTPLEECVKRNAQRKGVEKVREQQIYFAAQIAQKPTIKEGWDYIKHIQLERD